MAIDDTLLLKFADCRLPALYRSCMMRIFGRLLIPCLWDGNRLHPPYFNSAQHNSGLTRHSSSSGRHPALRHTAGWGLRTRRSH